MINYEEMIAINEEGYNAKYNGISLSDNPHASGTDKYRAWNAGWGRAARDIRETEGWVSDNKPSR